MKVLICFFICLMGSSAFAGYPRETDDWSVIFDARNVEVQRPTIRLNDGVNTHIENVCLGEETLRTKTKFKKCVRWYQTRQTRWCKEYKYEYRYADLTREVRRCVRWRNIGDRDRVCTEYTVDYVEVPMNYEFEVYELHINRGGRYRGQLLFTKEYSIPNC